MISRDLSSTKFNFLSNRILRLIGIFVALVIAGLLYVATIGISFDMSGQRNKIAAKLSETLGREIHLDGPLQLEISARPKLRLGGLHIHNAEGSTAPEFASLGEARLELDLWSLLLLRFQIDELSGSDVNIHLQMSKNGTNNWTFPSNEKKI